MIQASPATTKKQQQSIIPANYDRQFGFLLACFSAFLFAVSSFVVSETTNQCASLSSLHLSVIRNFVQVTIAAISCKAKGHPVLGRDWFTRKWLLLQALFFIIA